MRPAFNLLVTGLVLTIAQMQSLGGIVDATGAVTIVNAPADVRDDALVSDNQIVAFSERQNVVLPQVLTFNISQPGTSPGAATLDLSPVDLPVGTLVDSYFVHFQSITGTHATPVFASGSITFDTDVLGIAVFDRRLNESDPVLGLLPTTLYPGSEREMEILAGGVLGVAGNDRITLSSDRRTVFIEIGNVGGPDQLRIVTAVPEPSAIVLSSLGAVCLAGWGWRRSREYLA